jgi:hypothetical protein
METVVELQSMLKRLKAKWDKGNFGDPQEIVKLDRQMKELRKKIQAMEGLQQPSQ